MTARRREIKKGYYVCPKFGGKVALTLVVGHHGIDEMEVVEKFRCSSSGGCGVRTENLGGLMIIDWEDCPAVQMLWDIGSHAGVLEKKE